ncbi:hypothetical protein CN506_20575 [Bacillus thuringiensis]|nr:hypothetical protein CN506_20575 [Bacillus thuringiensis]
MEYYTVIMESYGDAHSYKVNTYNEDIKQLLEWLDESYEVLTVTKGDPVFVAEHIESKSLEVTMLEEDEDLLKYAKYHHPKEQEEWKTNIKKLKELVVHD